MVYVRVYWSTGSGDISQPANIYRTASHDPPVLLYTTSTTYGFDKTPNHIDTIHSLNPILRHHARNLSSGFFFLEVPTQLRVRFIGYLPNFPSVFRFIDFGMGVLVGLIPVQCGRVGRMSSMPIPPSMVTMECICESPLAPLHLNRYTLVCESIWRSA